MDIHALISQYSGAGNISSQRSTVSAALSNKTQSSAVLSGFASPGDAVVNISSEARRLGENGLPGWVNEKLEKLRANPDQKAAMQQVEWLTAGIEIHPPLYLDNPNSDNVHGNVYFHSREPVTPENKQRYSALAQASTTKMAEIFHAEKAKGSSAAEIFEKAQQYMATLPDDYLHAIGWFKSTFAYGDI
jgi:hypothetical protein